MESTINLLPPELAPKSHIIKVAGILKRIAIAGFLVYVIFVIAILLYLYNLTKKSQESLAALQGLETSVSALQETEQRLILIQNRLSLIDQIVLLPSSNKHIVDFRKMVNTLTSDIEIVTFKIGSKEVKFSTDFDNSDEMEEFLNFLQGYEPIATLTLDAFRYTPTFGYRADFTVNYN